MSDNLVNEYFAAARERHAIYLRRQAGQARPWTTDPIFGRYRFTNVFRELDRTTQWFAQHVRGPLRNTPEVLLATVFYRWFNRVEVCEVLFKQGDMLDGTTPWEAYLHTGSMARARAALTTAFPRGPYVTGSYIIRGEPGYSKLEGVCRCLEAFYAQSHWRPLAKLMLAHPGSYTLEQTTTWLEHTPYLGGFMAYEVVSDLRWTALLDQAPDILTWANPGPGAKRGLNRVFGRVHECPLTKAKAVEEMHYLLEQSRLCTNWPFSYRMPWEMREVEHWCCEFDKYMRTKLGQGRPRGVYN